MTPRGIASAGLVALVLAGCSSTSPTVATSAPKPQPITLEQALGCGPGGIALETLEPMFTDPDWATPEQAAAGLAVAGGRGVMARRWAEVSTLPNPLGNPDTDSWVVYDSQTQWPVALVSVSKLPDINGSALRVGKFGGGVDARCK